MRRGDAAAMFATTTNKQKKTRTGIRGNGCGRGDELYREFFLIHLLEPKAADGLVLFQALVEPPLPHDKGIVDGKAVNLIDPHAEDVFVGLLIPRKMGRGAGRSESTRKREEDNALPSEQVLVCQVLPIKRVLII